MKKFNFAITDNTTYYGEDLYTFYTNALLEAPSAKTFFQLPGVKDSVKVPSYLPGNIIKDAGCSWSATGEGTLAQKTMEVCPKDIQLELCTTTFEQNFLGQLLKDGSLTGETAPKAFEDFMLDTVAKKVQNDLEIVTWQGDADSVTYPYSICDGLLVKFDADSAVIDVPGTTPTSSTIIAEMQKVYEAIPQTILYNPDLVIYMPTALLALYDIARANESNESYFTGKREANFMGIPIVWAPGLPENVMVAAMTQNLVQLTDLMNEEETLMVIPQLDKSGVRSTRYVGSFKIGYDYKVGAEIVYYVATT